MIGKKEIWYLLTLFVISLSGCISDSEVKEWSLRPGDALPRFEVTTLSGETVSSADSYAGELIIVFFNTTCADCRRELPVLQSLYEADLLLPADERKRYICISRAEREEDVRRYWTENHLTLPVAAQDDRKIYSQFASVGIPRIFHARDGVITMSLYPAE